MNDALERYFRSQQVPLQWSPILRALARQLAEDCGPDTSSLRAMFQGVGQRFAQSVSDLYAGSVALPDLAEAINGLWSELNWGLVDFSEQADHVSIQHHFAPLAEAFGSDSLDWSVGLLEGFYQAAFRQLGASDELAVAFVAQEDDGMRLDFRFAIQEQFAHANAQPAPALTQ